ncbi:hypothetical protein TrVFT333_005477 [Trichoderma virens FT-333]|nr:hypothetical protein TrVFT333_005477 [Trichoderma virens FT-333]
MLSIFLTEELERRTQGTRATELLLFYFCTADEKHNNAVAILRGLAYQLVKKRPSLANHVLSDFESPKKTEETLKSPSALWITLEKLLQTPDLGTVFCVLDGLDECDDDSSRLLVGKFCEYFLKSSKPTGSQFKLAIVSRKIDELDAFPQVKLDPDNDEHVNDDIRRFIASSVQRLERIQGFNDIPEEAHASLAGKSSVRKHWWESYKKVNRYYLFDPWDDPDPPLLYIASYFGIDELARKLLKTNGRYKYWGFMRRMSLNLPKGNRYGITPLCLAATEGHMAMVQLLLANGANWRGGEELKWAASGGDVAIVQLLTANAAGGRKNFAIPGEFISVALSEAAHEGHLAMVQLLLKVANGAVANGADGNIEFGKALSEAAGEGHEGIVQLLLANGANDEGDEALMRAAGGGHEAIVQLLLATGSTKSTDTCTWALRYAVAGGHEAVVQLFLANGADDKDGKALSEAARLGHETIVQLLLANGAQSQLN